MYGSLTEWINVSYQIKPCIGRYGTGDKIFGATVASKCYPVSDVTLVVDNTGAEVTSTTQLYVPGTEAIKVTDNVIFEGEERPVLRISTYYRRGVADIKVVYL